MPIWLPEDLWLLISWYLRIDQVWMLFCCATMWRDRLTKGPAMWGGCLRVSHVWQRLHLRSATTPCRRMLLRLLRCELGNISDLPPCPNGMEMPSIPVVLGPKLETLKREEVDARNVKEIISGDDSRGASQETLTQGSWLASIFALKKLLYAPTLLEYYKCGFLNVCALRKELNDNFHVFELSLNWVLEGEVSDVQRAWQRSWTKLFVVVMESIKTIRQDVLRRIRVAVSPLGSVCHMLKHVAYDQESTHYLGVTMWPEEERSYFKSKTLCRRLYRRMHFIHRNLVKVDSIFQ